MSKEIEQLFEKSGAILKGHFLLTSGLHSPVYWEKFQVLQFPAYTVQLCHMIADFFKDKDIQLVVGPTTGGIILAFEVARQMGLRAIYAEKEGTVRSFRRGFTMKPGERVLIVDDILTTGGSVDEVVDAVNKLGGKTAGIAVLVNRSEKELDFGVPLFSCHRTIVPTYKPEKCPLCAAGLPLVKPGSSQKVAG